MAPRKSQIVLAHTRTGEGPPLVLLHGVGGRREMWEPVVPLLAPHREVIMIDLPGFGASALVEGQDLQAAGLATTVADFCAQLGLDRPHYVMGKPWKTPRTVLLADSAAMLASEAFKLTLASASGQRFEGGHDIEVPITIAFGTRDVILGPGCRHRGELPAHTRWLSPRGWGHLPIYDDPKGVAAVLLEGSSAGVDHGAPAAS